MRKLIVARVTVISLAVLVGVVGWPSAAGAKPISKQSCKELVRTSRRIVRDLANKSVEVQRKAAEDAGKRDDRVARLDGCLSKEAKMRTPPTSPTGAAGDAGVTPDSLAHYLPPLAFAWQGVLAPDELVHLGVTLCAELDTGRSIADVSKQLIREIKQAATSPASAPGQGVSATDASDAFDGIAQYATQNGDKSFCNRHSQKVDAYDNNGMR
ncbi:MAG: hypothetical protein M3046_13705 [Actinomycetota bacterium]|nr:hypothetical protein [Actinomycetota bacterium]MDQ6910289.1 hypothetical protein [Actinomycetota bacterium]